MKRFENAKVGDKVYCRINGFGTIQNIGKYAYPIAVYFENRTDSYTLDGQYTFYGYHFFSDLKDSEPILFYVDGDNKYSETRPKQKVEKTGWINVYPESGTTKDENREPSPYIYQTRIEALEEKTKDLIDTIQITWFEEE